MRIYGLQKTTLLDFPGLVACTVFTGGCNLRCPFCHNSSLVTSLQNSESQSEEVFFDFLNGRKGKLDGVCVTGGEPLMQPDIEEFIKRIKEMGFKVKLDTNGTYPEKLISLVNSGLVDYVAMDIKNCLDKYPETVGLSNFDVTLIIKSTEFLMNCNIPYEFRTTAVKEFHEKEDFEKIGTWLHGARKYYIQQFEDSGAVIREGLNPLPIQELRAFKGILEPHFKEFGIRGI